MTHPDPPRTLGRALFAGLASFVTLAGACTRLDTPASTSVEGGVSSSYGTAGSTAVSTAADGAVVTHTASSSSTSSGPPMRGPVKATATTNFPFPQNRQTPATRCIYPTDYQNGDVQAAYAKFKTDLVTSNNANGHRRIQRTASDGQDACRPLNSTVSEGIGYGMLIAVYMDDQSLFDDLWLYEQTKLNSDDALMNWAPDGSGPGCANGATDADEDMAFALVMADRQWGGQGSIGKTYLSAAVGQIQAVWMHEVFHYLWLAPGDHFGDNTIQNISYLAPAYYRIFDKVDPASCAPGIDASKANPPCDGWLGLITQSYATISDALNSANGNQNNGLVPAWCDDSHGAPCGPSSVSPFNYQYDSCRTPFRIGLDWCWFGDSNAQSYVSKTSAFFAPKGAAGVLDGYNLDGTSLTGAQPNAPPFIGPAAVGAMSAATYQSFVDGSYALLATGTALQGGEYYAQSWTVLSLLMMTGNFLDYTNQNPVH
jgi:endo-1,4-beta-D-glucanase Y